MINVLNKLYCHRPLYYWCNSYNIYVDVFLYDCYYNQGTI